VLDLALIYQSHKIAVTIKVHKIAVTIKVHKIALSSQLLATAEIKEKRVHRVDNVSSLYLQF
jgi:hypothetical protein